MQRNRAAKKIAARLGDDRAREALLALCGYSGHPEGLVARLGVELARALPLHTTPADLDEFGRRFDKVRLMTLARVEAREPAPTVDAAIPASRVELGVRRAERLWPFVSGQRVLRLARAHLVAEDAFFAVAAATALREFCQINPPLMGPAWAGSGLVAVRAVNWLLALAMLGDPSRLGADLVVTVMLHISIMAQVLAEECARPDPPVTAAAGLLVVAHTLPFVPQAEEWMASARQALALGLDGYAEPGPARPCRQVGVDAHFAALACWAMGRQKAAEGPASGLARLAGMCRAMAPPWSPAMEWGHTPVRSMLELDPADHLPYGPAANLAAVVLNDPDLRAGREPDEGLFWLIGPQAPEWLRQLAGGRPPGVEDLPGAGLTWLAAKTGRGQAALWVRSSPRLPAGPAEAAGALDLGLALDGHVILALPGPAGEGPLAGFLASRSAHSTLRIDGVDPGSGAVEVRGLESGPNHLFAALSFDGYAALEDPVRLVRRVHLDTKNGIVTIVDQVLAAGRHKVELFFHLAAGVEVEPDAEGGLLLGGPFGRVVLKTDRACRGEVVRGRDDPPLGWRADGGGGVHPAPTLRLEAAIVGEAGFTTVLAPA